MAVIEDVLQGICKQCSQDMRTHIRCSICGICIGNNHTETELYAVNGKKVCYWCKNKIEGGNTNGRIKV